MAAEIFDRSLQDETFLIIGLALSAILVFMLTVYLCVWFRKKGDTSSQISDNEINGVFLKAGEDAEERNSKRASKRKLPEIPDLGSSLEAGELDNLDETNRSSKDTGSELYAQVDVGSKTESNVSNGHPVIALRSVGDQEDVEACREHSYDQVETNHNYSKLKKKEHPYARVKRTDAEETKIDEIADENETDTDNYDVVCVPQSASQDHPQTVGVSSDVVDAPGLLVPPLPLSSHRGSHSSLVVNNDSAPRPPPRGRRVQSAILGLPQTVRPESGVGPDEEEMENNEANHADNENSRGQIHFSGDSQASQDSRGYSSISVREPIANLKAREANTRSQRRGSETHGVEIVDPHYATVSEAEDSDEMYAAIAEPAPLYSGASESDTYAKISDENQDSIVLSPSTDPSNEDGSSSTPHPPTPPSVVSLRQLSLGSGRLNASTLSVASQTSGYGSPKPEKRQANSPLPPPPVAQIDNRRSFNIDDMYAKVIKKKGLSISRQINAQHRGSVDLGFLSTRPDETHNSRRNSIESAPTSMLPEIPTEPVDEKAALESSSPSTRSDDEDDDPYEELRAGRKISESDPGYEKIVVNADPFNDPCYEKIRIPENETNLITDPNYEVVRYGTNSEPGYEEVQTVSVAFDPNYESLHYATSSVCDSPYERLDKENPADVVEEPAPDTSTLYAQVVKPKRSVTHSVAEEETPVTVLHDSVDFTVNSSENNTTIIRIHDSSTLYYSYPDGESLGIPEHV